MIQVINQSTTHPPTQSPTVIVAAGEEGVVLDTDGPTVTAPEEPQEPFGLPRLVLDRLREVDAETRAAVLSHIVVQGVTASLPGVPERLEQELRRLLPEHEARLVKVTRSVCCNLVHQHLLRCRTDFFANPTPSWCDYPRSVQETTWGRLLPDDV